VDEIQQITNLTSLYHLIVEYLPEVPGGSPGDYLLTLPINKHFPFNKYMLGSVGLVSHILVFIFLPWAIKKLNVVHPEHIKLITIVARALFVFDPTFTFQSMEVRPYASLPFYWIVSLFLVSKLLRFDVNKKRSLSVVKKVITILLLTLLFVWHYYTILMFLSIYIYLKLQLQLQSFKNLLKSQSTKLIFYASSAALPFWFYFASREPKYTYDTLSTIPIIIMQIYAIDKGEPKGLAWQNWIYFFMLVCMLVIIAIFLLSILTKYKILNQFSINTFVKMNFILVILPIFAILSLDLVKHYMFLYRQFVWTMLPFYISIGSLVSGLFIRWKNIS
jgi:hypothetical protein